MAGTDSTKAFPAGPAPVVILVQPQLAENVGTVARAMRNCCLKDLRLVRPRQDWLSEKARAASSGGEDVLEAARNFDTTEEALADLEFVVATTARPRDMIKTVWTPRKTGGELQTRLNAGQACGLLFGREKSGLTNHDVGLADVICEVPLNPAYSSLNLAQAVLITAYEWYQAGIDAPDSQLPMGETRPANHAELVLLFEHLEHELDECGFLRVTEMRPSMVLALRSIFQRAALTEQEVRTLHGVVTELRYGRRDDRTKRNDWKRKNS